MDTLVEIGKAIIDFVVGVIGSGHSFKRLAKGKKTDSQSNEKE